MFCCKIGQWDGIVLVYHASRLGEDNSSPCALPKFCTWARLLLHLEPSLKVPHPDRTSKSQMKKYRIIISSISDMARCCVCGIPVITSSGIWKWKRSLWFHAQNISKWCSLATTSCWVQIFFTASKKDETIHWIPLSLDIHHKFNQAAPSRRSQPRFNMLSAFLPLVISVHINHQL